MADSHSKKKSGSRGKSGKRRSKRRSKRKSSRKRRSSRGPVWIPRTLLGDSVKGGIITSVEEIFANNYKVREKEIFDILLPNIKETVVDISMVQKQSDSGQQSRFKAIVCVGNRNGYVGIATSKTKEVGHGIRKAIAAAKLNIIPVKRGCGSWECNCGGDHSIPYTVHGKSGSVKVTLKPAAKGTGLVASAAARIPLDLVGIKDCYVHIKGNSKNAENTAKAIVNAFENAYKMMVPHDWTI
ncbi:MAG: 30S ribosomal protein S5 [Candidatus Lokiarchaeota archaeon]|nr:30S ribosomal protein S5 [Candidatus Lokiarchaeota archaeon]